MLNNIFDSHAHYDDHRFDEDRDELIASLWQNGVCGVVNAGTNVKDSQEHIEFAQKHPNFYASVGVHPLDACEVDGDYIDRLRELAKMPKVVAIGEIGLDYHYDVPPTVQMRVFERQLKLAKELDMPVIIHSREATADVLAKLEEYKLRGVVHCFSGSPETAKKLLDMGYYIGFTGVVTFPNAKKPLESAKVVPLDRIMLETDCPYMAPVPHRGKRCDSRMIQATAQFIADLKGVDAQHLVNCATENTKKLFGIE